MKKILILFIVIYAYGVDYTRLDFVGGISVDMPSNFHQLNKNYTSAIRSQNPNSGQIPLLMANTNTKQTRATIRLNLYPFEFSRDDVIFATQNDLIEYENILYAQMRQNSLAPVILSHSKVEKIDINAVVSLATSYIRTDPRNSDKWQVNMYIIPYSGAQMLYLTMSYNLKYADIYVPIFAEVLNSLNF